MLPPGAGSGGRRSLTFPRKSDGVDAPRRHLRAKVKAFEPSPKEASVDQVTTIGLDIAKYIFQAHGADAAGHTLFRKRLVRRKLLEFLPHKRPALWQWKPAPVRTIGRARSASWGTRYG